MIDNKTPGIAQLGSVWLPLPHLLMLPFAASYTLWRNGLAGSFVSMICYILSAICIFKIVKLLTNNVYASTIGSLIFIFNPNILYMQSIPMTELSLIATMLFGTYFFVKWLFNQLATSLVLYEGWFVLAVCTLIILVEGTVFTKRKNRSEGQALLFATLGSFGILLWILWNLAIFGNPLYFLDGPYSAQAQQKQLAASGHLPTKYNFLLSLHTIFQTIYMNVGGLIIILAFSASIIVYLRFRKNKNIIYALLVLLAPVILDLITLVFGVTAITTNLPKTFNIRYGTMAVPFIAVLIAVAFSSIKVHNFVKSSIATLLVIAVFLVPVVTLNSKANDSWVASPSTLAFEDAISSNYKDGNILASDYVFDPLMQQVGIPLHNYIEEGNGSLWKSALGNPRSHVNYVLMSTGNGRPDPVYKDYLKNRLLFDKYFRVAYDNNGYELLVIKARL